MFQHQKAISSIQNRLFFWFPLLLPLGVMGCGRGEGEFTGQAPRQGQEPSVVTAPTWYWESPTPLGNPLYAMSGVSGATTDDDILFAVGNPGIIFQGNSKSWQKPMVDWANVQLPGNLFAVSNPTSNGNMLAVGSCHTAVIQVNGHWRGVTLSTGAAENCFYGVWANPLSPDEFFVVGLTGKIFHVTNLGTQWDQEASGLTTNNLLGIWGRTSGTSIELFAVGEGGTILYRDVAGKWSQESTPLNNDLNAIVGPNNSSGEVYAVGRHGTVLHRLTTSGWFNQTQPGITSDFLAATFVANELFMAGANGLLVHHAGNSWTVETLSDVSDDLKAMWGTVHGSQPIVYAVGNHGAILQRENGAWKSLRQMVTHDDFSSVWARSDGEVYAATQQGTMFRRSVDAHGYRWSNDPAPINADSQINAISGYSPTEANAAANVYAVGAQGLILHKSESGWQSEAGFLTTKDFNAVWVGPSDTVFVVGQEGRMKRKSLEDLPGVNSHWSSEDPVDSSNQPLVKENLRSVWADTSSGTPIFYIGGDGGKIYMRDAGGAYHQEGVLGITDNIIALFGSSSDDVYAVGSQGNLLHRQHGIWEKVEFFSALLGKPPYLVGTALQNRDFFILESTTNAFLHFTPQLGSGTVTLDNTLSSITVQSIASLSAINGTNIYAVGNAGFILHYH